MTGRSPRESSVKDAVQRYLKSLGKDCWHFKTHGSIYGILGLPDIIGVYKGRFFGVELKRPGEKPRKIQGVVMKAIARAGGVVGVATSKDEMREIIEGMERGEA